MMHQSPFATHFIQFEDVMQVDDYDSNLLPLMPTSRVYPNYHNTSESIREFFKRQKMLKYVFMQLSYHNGLETSASDVIPGESTSFTKLRKSHKYNDDVGILMVENKKPFNVRFDKNLAVE